MSQVTTAAPSDPSAVCAQQRESCTAGELLASLKKGDRAALEEIFDRYHRYLLRVLGNILGQDSEVGDALQETYIRAMKNIAQLEEPRALASWLGRVATFTAMDMLRKRKRRRWLRLAPAETLAEHPSSGPDEDAREAVRRTYAILGRMREDESAAFSLRFICEMELKEIAHVECSNACA